MSSQEQTPEQYTAESIQVLDGIEHVRLRPAMYIGDTGERGLHHLVEEIVANSIDEAMIGECEAIHVVMHTDGSISVADDGRGIPVDIHRDTGTSALEVVMTTLNAGGKFDHNSYKVSAGLHGVGLSCVNALSEWAEVEVWSGGQMHYQRYERGEAKTPVEVRGKTNRHGTKVRFMPDTEIFDTTTYKWDIIANRLRELAFLNSGTRIYLEEGATDRKIEFYYEGGIAEFVRFLNENKESLHEDVINVEGELDGIFCDIALQYNNTYNEIIFSFANNINTHEGGTHLSGLRSALTRTFNNYGRERGIIKDTPPTGQDYREGLTAVISVKLPDPQFEGQTKMKLGNREVGGLVEQLLNDKLARYCEENPASAKAIVNKAQEANRARDAARKARDLTRRKGVLSGSGLPGTLKDCSSKEVEQTELFIVEGQSAGGTAGMGRSREFQAILPLRGVILNVEKARVDKMLSNEQILRVITALGTGVGTDDFDITKLRYGKVIIMTDADVDGAHIRTLLLTFFYRQMPQLIDDGHVYIAKPPLYKVTRKSKSRYVEDDDALQATLLSLGITDATLKFKLNGSGKGELPPVQFEDLMNQLAELENLIRRLEKRGVSFPKYAEARRQDPQGRFPLYRLVHVDDMLQQSERTFYSEEDYDAFVQEEHAKLVEKGDDLEIVEEDYDLGQEARTDWRNTIRPVRFDEARAIGRIARNIEQYGVPLSCLFDQTEEGGEPEHKFTIRTEKDEASAPSLFGLMEVARELGRRGLDIQRYKGLGEMNAQELAETTLNPENRHVVRVTVGDALRADNYFTTLAGKDVERRRAFIERHALDVTNLDV